MIILMTIQVAVIYLSLYFKHMICQNCTFQENCFWKTERGFSVIPVDELVRTFCSENDTCSSVKGGSVFASDIKSNSSGSLESQWILSNAFPSGLCLLFNVYSLHETETTDQINLTLIIINGEEEKLTKIAIYIGRFGKVEQKIPTFANRIKLRIDIAAKGNSEAVIVVDNIVVSDECTKDTCVGRAQFMCTDNSCITWNQTCNLQNDCDNGRDEAEICANLPSVYRCTFEVDECGWSNVSDGGNNKLVWLRHQGPSPTPYTGPEVDHTTRTKQGYYMYIETSERDMLQTAILNSLVLPPLKDRVKQEQKCVLRFFYHMRGRNVGVLQVKMVDLCGLNRKPISLWSIKGNQENTWHYAEVRIRNTTSRYLLQFHGSGALMGHGDIAIDDVTLSPECFDIEHNLTHFINTFNISDTITIQEFRNNSDAHCKNRSVASSESNVGQIKSEQSIFFNVGSLIAIILCLIIMFFIVCGVMTYRAMVKRKDSTMQSVHHETTSTVPASITDVQFRCAVTEFNPNYDFISAKYPEQQLREIPRNKLTLIRLLGQGAFGEVYEGKLRNLCPSVEEMPVAVKTLPTLCTEQAETDFLMEAVIISKFMHKNVVKCLGVCFEEAPKYIILELLEGDLKTFLRDSRPTAEHPCSINMEDLLKLSLDIAHGCRHLEEKHFVHRDIACRNCLLTTSGPGRIAKIADFGMSRDIYSADYYKKGGKAMLPIKWMPPEAFLDGVFTTKTDVWSFGVLLWEMLTLGYIPYPGQTNNDVMHFVASGGRLDPPENCPGRLNKIMIMCWNSVADIRPSFSEIIELLEMCLQDREVTDSDPAMCHLHIAESFKDASTLAKSYPPGMEINIVDQTDNTAAEFHIHVESQSREPLLLTSDDK